MKLYLLLLLPLIFIGCANKSVTVSALKPSSIPNLNIHNVILEQFENDDINQTDYLEEAILNKIVEGKRIFTLQVDYKNIDAIITGRVLTSTIDYDFYFDEETDYSRCIEYEYKDKKKTSKCLEYRTKRIPCERKNFTVETKVQLLNKNEQIIFSKIYPLSKFTDECYKNSIYYPHPYYFNRANLQKDKYIMNRKIAREIAYRVLNDISPHYVYQNIILIDELKDKNYGENIENEFEFIIELLDNQKIELAKTRLIDLESKITYPSHEILYNLALTYEFSNELSKAKEYYEEAKLVCNNMDDLQLIDEAINRIEINEVDKIKAKEQIPN